jgi:predicted enzyme related to lactoylglutathione lyase
VTRVKYVHTNLIARDWRRLARFYQDVFGCVPVPPERNLGGAEIDAGTGIRNAHVRGMHLRLPGADADGPTLEIFEYAERGPETPHEVNQFGFAHIAFAVGSVHDARASVLSHGGSPVGEIVTTTISPTTRVTWCYVRDPEGNIVELQTRTDESLRG